MRVAFYLSTILILGFKVLICGLYALDIIIITIISFYLPLDISDLSFSKEAFRFNSRRRSSSIARRAK